MEGRGTPEPDYPAVKDQLDIEPEPSSPYPSTLREEALELYEYRYGDVDMAPSQEDFVRDYIESNNEEIRKQIYDKIFNPIFTVNKKMEDRKELLDNFLYTSA